MLRSNASYGMSIYGVSIGIKQQFKRRVGNAHIINSAIVDRPKNRKSWAVPTLPTNQTNVVQ
jgi:hypothetical protein